MHLLMYTKVVFFFLFLSQPKCYDMAVCKCACVKNFKKIFIQVKLLLLILTFVAIFFILRLNIIYIIYSWYLNLFKHKQIYDWFNIDSVKLSLYLWYSFLSWVELHLGTKVDKLHFNEVHFSAPSPSTDISF